MVLLAFTSMAGLLAVAIVEGGAGTNFDTGILALSTTALVFVDLMSRYPSPGLHTCATCRSPLSVGPCRSVGRKEFVNTP